MIDPQAKPRAYIKLMGLVILLGMISALATFAFITLVHQGTYLLWQEASQALGIDAARLNSSLPMSVKPPGNG